MLLLMLAVIRGWGTPMFLAIVFVVPLILLNFWVLSRRARQRQGSSKPLEVSRPIIHWLLYGGLAFACALLWYANVLGVAQILAIFFVVWITHALRQDYRKRKEHDPYQRF